MPDQNTTSGTGANPKYYYYYPAYNAKYPRRVLAGLVTENKILVAEAVCFSGRKGEPGASPKVQLLQELVNDGVISKDEASVYMPEMGMKPDQFVKKRGRSIAERRATLALSNPEKYCVLSIDIPEGTQLVGKLFVDAVEAIFPKTMSKRKKAKLREVVTA